MNDENGNKLEPLKWVERYSDKLYRFAYYRVNDEQLAEDLVQDTFLSALKARESYKGQASESTWLTSILKNKIIDHYKKASTRNESPLKLKSEEAPSYDHFFNSKKMGKWQKDSEPGNWSISENKSETKEFYSVLEKCLSLLPVKWKGVFTMSLLDEEDSVNICKEFKLSSSNFWVIMHRAKLQMRECLEKNWIKA